MFKVVYIDYFGEMNVMYIRGIYPDEFEKNNKRTEVISVTLI